MRYSTTLRAGGLLAIGQAIVLLTGLGAHGATGRAAAVLIVVGLVLLVVGARGPRAIGVSAAGGRAVWLGASGVGLACAILLHGSFTHSGLSAPEWWLIAYGALLAAAATRLDSRMFGVRVATFVAWSFPLVLAPLGLWALDAALASWSQTHALRWAVTHFLVGPTANVLGLLGTPTSLDGSTLRLESARGPIFLTIGATCAGLYMGVIFLGVFGVLAWEARASPRRTLAWLAFGLVGVWFANVARLALLAHAGSEWGAAALYAFHQHAGWVLVLGWTILFSALAIPRLKSAAPQRASR